MCSLSEKDTGISFVRFIAMIFIITCHFMQYFKFELAWWLNVGVQIFLCISGYLYSNKKIETVKFYKRTFKKILIPFFIVAIIFYSILFITKTIGIQEIIKSLLLASTVSGGGHLWFIPTILFCYFITPIISSFYDNCENIKSIFLTYFVMLIVAFLSLQYIIVFFNPAWITCYITGYFIGRLSKYENGKILNISYIILFVITFIANLFQIICDYVIHFKFLGYGIFCNYAHFLLGTSLFVVLRNVFAKAKYCKLLSFSDTYSYEIYLVHQFFILGPLSLMKLTSYVFVNVILILAIVLISGIIVNKLAKIATKACDKIYEKTINAFISK